jgi:hypothetical protein
MAHAINRDLSKVFAHASWLLPREPARDVVEVLSEGLGPGWTVHRETDCEGDVSVIALPADEEAIPAFILYEKGGVARVATVRGDDWEGDWSSPSFELAIAMIITEAAFLNNGT